MNNKHKIRILIVLLSLIKNRRFMININIRKYFVIIAVTAGLCGSMAQGMGYFRGLCPAGAVEKLSNPRYQLGGIVLAGIALYGGYHLWKKFSCTGPNNSTTNRYANRYNVGYKAQELNLNVIYTIDITQSCPTVSGGEVITGTLNREDIRATWDKKSDDYRKALKQFVDAQVIKQLQKKKGVVVQLNPDFIAGFRGAGVSSDDVMTRLIDLFTTNALKKKPIFIKE
jgi:hypothetical protein